MSIVLQRVDAVPLAGNQLDFLFQHWLITLVDGLNTTIEQIEARLNVVELPQLTTVQIMALAVDAPNGSLFYDTSTNQIKAKSNNIVVVIV